MGRVAASMMFTPAPALNFSLTATTAMLLRKMMNAGFCHSSIRSEMMAVMHPECRPSGSYIQQGMQRVSNLACMQGGIDEN